MKVKHHFPPELFELLVETISCLFKSKKSVLTFFQGAGVDHSMTKDLQLQLRRDRDSIYKYDIARTVLVRLNEAGDNALRERREIVKRVCEFDDFSTCWPEDQHKAMGLVARVQNIVDRHDFFRRLQQQHESELRQHRESKRKEVEQLHQRREQSKSILQEINSLVLADDPHNRGKRLENVMNRFFASDGILVRESFALVEEPGQGISEQIDGVIQLDGEIYLVEMKWLNKAVDVEDVSRHISRVLTRSECRGLFISYSGYTDPAITTCKQAMKHAPIVLCTLKEFVMLLEKGKDVQELLRAKVHGLIIDKKPFTEIL